MVSSSVYNLILKAIKIQIKENDSININELVESYINLNESQKQQILEDLGFKE